MKRIIITLLLTLSILSISAQQPKTQWEYKVEFNIREKKANDLGAQGWELVAIGSSGSGPTSNVTEYIFKRPKN